MIAGAALRIDPAGEGDVLGRIARDLLADDLVRFEDTLARALEPQARYLTSVERAFYERGKRVRPIMLLLSARLHAGAARLPEKAIMAAVSLEMLHVATLIHDDVIDDAPLRRGLPSIHAARGPAAAIVLGDMQFVQAIRTFVDAIDTESEMGLVKLVLDTAFRICAGELEELETDPAAPPAVLRSRALQVLERKTAILFGLACETGVSITGGRTSDARRIGFYGRRVGRAFQMIDDLFDVLQTEEQSGKQAGIDLVQRRLSLPVVYALEELGPDSALARTLRGEACAEPAALLASVRATAAITRTYADARHQAIDALEYLRRAPAGPYRDALADLALHTVERGY